ncbi:hypothetical protein [Streptomyces collinus]|uniref:hypothetical protein n=1 Tax=Streptomyces collinus TaxID=42684 RepID=UPI0011DC95B2|nr:hypothetical protein [Streptomyces collinus]
MTWIRRALATVPVITLLGTAAQFAWLGSQDVNGALTYTGRLRGTFLILAVAAILTALAAYIRHLITPGNLTGFACKIVFVTIALSLAVNVTLLVLKVASRSHTPHLSFWLTLAILSFTSLIYLWPRRIVITVLIITLLATAAEFAWLGSEDVNGALTYAGRLNGILLLMAVVVAITALAAYIEHLFVHNTLKGFACAVVVVGISLSLAVNVTLLILQAETWSYTPYLWIWVFLFLSSLTMLICLYLQHRKRQVEIPRPKAFAVGAVVTILIAAANFGYAEVYQPYSTPASISASVEIGHAKVINGKVTLPIHLKAKNTGSVSVYTLGSLFQVTARGPIYSKHPLSKGDRLRDINDGQPVLYAYEDERGKSYDLLAQGRFVRQGLKLDPGTEIVTDSIVQFPSKKSYEVIDASADMVYIRADRVVLVSDLYRQSGRSSWHKDGSHAEKVEAPKWVAENNETFKFQSRIVHSDAFLEYTRSARYVTLWWVLEEPTRSWNGPFLVPKISPFEQVNSEPDPAEAQRLTDEYGLGQSSSGRAQKTMEQLIN